MWRSTAVLLSVHYGYLPLTCWDNTAQWRAVFLHWSTSLHPAPFLMRYWRRVVSPCACVCVCWSVIILTKLLSSLWFRQYETSLVPRPYPGFLSLAAQKLGEDFLTHTASDGKMGESLGRGSAKTTQQQLKTAVWHPTKYTCWPCDHSTGTSCYGLQLNTTMAAMATHTILWCASLMWSTVWHPQLSRLALLLKGEKVVFPWGRTVSTPVELPCWHPCLAWEDGGAAN